MIILTHTQNQTYAVMGLGKSGLSTVASLIKGGASVIAWDDDSGARRRAKDLGADVTDLLKVNWDNIDALVLAPGIPHTFPEPHPVAAAAKKAGVEIIGDIELLRREHPDLPIIAITGTNGKSTTTALVAHILREAGFVASVGGNLGDPALSLKPNVDWMVLEMSSFQLDLTPSLSATIAVLLNITPDHLERHGGMEGYIKSKAQIFKECETAIIGVDDEACVSLCKEHRAIPVSANWRLDNAEDGGVSAPRGILIDHRSHATMHLTDIPTLTGSHNWQNASAAWAATREAGVDANQIAEAIGTFPGLSHRQQLVTTVNDVTYINDSKATNATAAAKALACYDNIYWILGGRPKGDGLEAVMPYIKHVKAAFLIGEAMDDFETQLKDHIPCHKCADIATAVSAASVEAAKNKGKKSVVLLSPACASFDQFLSFEDRGDTFIRLVRGMCEKEESAA